MDREIKYIDAVQKSYILSHWDEYFLEVSYSVFGDETGMVSKAFTDALNGLTGTITIDHWFKSVNKTIEEPIMLRFKHKEDKEKNLFFFISGDTFYKIFEGYMIDKKLVPILIKKYIQRVVEKETVGKI